MNQFIRLALAAAVALAFTAPALADPADDGATAGGTSDSFTPPPAPPPPFGQGVNEFIGSLPKSGAGPVVIDYNFSGYTPPAGTPLSDLQVSYSDVVGLTGSAYDQYWMTNTSAPPAPRQQRFGAFNNSPPSGNVGEGDTANEGYAFTVTRRTVSFTALIPEPTPLLLVGAGLAALALTRRRSRVV